MQQWVASGADEKAEGVWRGGRLTKGWMVAEPTGGFAGVH